MRIEEVEPRKTQKKRKNQNQELRQKIPKSTVSGTDKYQPLKKARNAKEEYQTTGTRGTRGFNTRKHPYGAPLGERIFSRKQDSDGQ
jgi:hypothetical protein